MGNNKKQHKNCTKIHDVDQSVYYEFYATGCRVIVRTCAGHEVTGTITRLDSRAPGGVWIDHTYSTFNRIDEGTFVPFHAIASISVVSK